MDKKNIIKLLSATAAAVFFLTAFSGCGRFAYPIGRQTETESDTGTEAPTEEQTREPIAVHEYDPDLVLLAEAYLEAAPGGDLDGMDVFFTGPSVKKLSPDGASYISKTISDRNRAVEKKLNVKLNFSAATADSMYEDAAASVASGMYYTDVMLLPVSSVGKFYSGGNLTNLNSLPFFDLSRPYFDARSVEAFTAGGKTLAFCSDALPTLSYLPALYCSRALTDADRLVKAAEDGALTWDLLFAVAGESAASLGEEATVFSAGRSKGSVPERVLYTYGGTVVSTAGEDPTVALTDEILGVSSATAKMIVSSYPSGDKDGAAFKDGKAAFCINTVGAASSLQSESVDWRILPLPTGKEGDEVKTLVSSACPAFTVIAGTKNGDAISLVLTALGAASYGVIPERYVDEVIVTSMRDDGAGKVLDIIRKTACFDLSLAVSSESEDILKGTLGAVRSAAKGETVDLAPLIETANRALAGFFE